MTLNLTFLIQLLNFYVAYKIMKRFFVRPALEIIAQEETQRALSKERLNEVKRQVDDLVVRNNQAKAIFMETCHRHAPVIKKKEGVYLELNQQFTDPGPHDLKTSKQDVYHYLLKVVSND